MEKGLIHIYTGDGKGKTTASLGLGLRFIGSGRKACMVQFLKSGETGEINSAEKTDGLFTIKRFYEKEYGFYKFLSDTEKAEVRKIEKAAFDFCMDIAKSKKYDMLIMDEIICSVCLGIIKEEELISLMENKHPSLELVLTGRGATEKIIEKANYVSLINEVKHPMSCEDIPARKGIEF